MFDRKEEIALSVRLTKDADKLIVLIYKEYLSRRKKGFSRSVAGSFEFENLISFDKLSSWIQDDIEDALSELHQANLIEMDLSFSFDLTSEGIIYLENRFKNNLSEVTDFIAKFIP